MKLELKNTELFESIEQNTDMDLKSVVIGDIHHFNQAVENLADLKQTSKGEIEFFICRRLYMFSVKTLWPNMPKDVKVSD